MTDIVILDFGSQTTHLIARRLKNLGVSVKLIRGDSSCESVKKLYPRAVIFSGGPSSVYQKGGLLPDKKIYDLGLPLLGICYGAEIICHQLGGVVEKGEKGEYGKSFLTLKADSSLFKGIERNFSVWMSHFDVVSKIPKGFTHTSYTDKIEFSSFEDPQRKIYAVFFHPEVVHTQYGEVILKNFLDLANLRSLHPNMHVHKLVQKRIEEKIEEIKNVIGNKKAICALSGGVDSTTAAVLADRAIGKRLTCVYVDTGLMREGETEEVKKTFKMFEIRLKVVSAENEFLKTLKGISDPEEKRTAVGKTFIKIFERLTKRIGGMDFLIQGTIYPDVIESKGTVHSHKIKSHHNVAGLPQKMKLKVVEPLRDLYKDEVREMAIELGLPKEIVWRQVFPGPGLAVRIIGHVTKEKLVLLRKADRIVTDEVNKTNLSNKLWMFFAILPGIKTTGVVGDARIYGETIALRAVTSKDAMTCDWAKLPYDLLEKISNRLTSELPEVCRVVYDITTKPPATMEWE